MVNGFRGEKAIGSIAFFKGFRTHWNLIKAYIQIRLATRKRC